MNYKKLNIKGGKNIQWEIRIGGIQIFSMSQHMLENVTISNFANPNPDLTQQNGEGCTLYRDTT